MFNKLSLRNKAIVFAIALGTLPVIGCGALAYYITNKNAVHSTIQNQEYHAASLSDKINRFLFERYGDIQIIANLPILNNSNEATRITFQ
ncbi:MAG TPA: hypothetical protein V6D09_15940 [Leptolyngbyaceae cyanobacterium]